MTNHLTIATIRKHLKEGNNNQLFNWLLYSTIKRPDTFKITEHEPSLIESFPNKELYIAIKISILASISKYSCGKTTAYIIIKKELGQILINKSIPPKDLNLKIDDLYVNEYQY